MAINLLPQEEKEELTMAAIQRRILLFLLFVLIFFIILILILFCLKFYIALQANSLDNLILEKEKELKSTQFQNFKAQVTTINQNLAKIQNLHQEQILLQPILEKLSSLMPEAIYFTDLSLKKNFVEVENPKTSQKEKKFFAELRISGFASNRGALFSFKKNLEAESTFEEVYFLPSSWVKPTDINFSLSLKFVP